MKIKLWLGYGNFYRGRDERLIEDSDTVWHEIPQYRLSRHRLFFQLVRLYHLYHDRSFGAGIRDAIHSFSQIDHISAPGLNYSHVWTSPTGSFDPSDTERGD